MRYKEYLARHNGWEKKLGVLGEIHIYNPSDTELALDKVINFTNVAVEGADKKSSLARIGLLYFPMFMAYMLATNRSPNNLTALRIARRQKKNVMRLEEDEEQLFPLTQKIALGIGGLITSATAPMLYAYLKAYGDPFQTGTKAYERRTAKRRKPKEGLSRFLDFAYHNNLHARDKKMAERSVDLLKNGASDLLIVCGDGHMDGVIDNLETTIVLEEINSITI